MENIAKKTGSCFVIIFSARNNFEKQKVWKVHRMCKAHRIMEKTVNSGSFANALGKVVRARKA